MSTRLYTIGHSRHSTEQLLSMLQAYQVTRLVDVRRIPFSRFNPQFNCDRLADYLAQHLISYQHLEDLGGLRDPTGMEETRNTAWQNQFLRSYANHAQTRLFQDALWKLCQAAMDEICTIMCAEADWRQCHRQIVADYLILRDFEVLHILCDCSVEEARLTPHASVDAAGTLIYSKLSEQQLPLDLF